MGQCGGKSYTATCLFASRDFTMRGQKKHINESFSLKTQNPNNDPVRHKLKTFSLANGLEMIISSEFLGVKVD